MVHLLDAAVTKTTEIGQALDDCLTRHFPRQIGTIYGVCAAVCMSSLALCFKAFTHFPVYDIFFMRGLVQFVLNRPIVAAQEDRYNLYPRDNRTAAVLIVNSTLSSVSTFLMFKSYQTASMAKISVLWLTSPVWSWLLGLFCFGENFALKSVGFVILCLAGVALVTHPAYAVLLDHDASVAVTDEESMAYALVLAGAVCFSLVSNTNKYLRGQVSAPVLLQYMYGANMIVGAVLMVHEEDTGAWELFKVENFGFILGISFLTYVMQMMMNRALFREATAYIHALQYIQFVVGAAYDEYVFASTVNAETVVGSVLVVASAYKIVDERARTDAYLRGDAASAVSGEALRVSED